MRATLMSLALIGATLTACEPLPPPPDYSPGALRREILTKEVDSIPYQYGDLVAVTSLPDQPFTQVLWFVQPDKTIIAVSVNLSIGRFGSVMTVPRR